VAIFDTGQGVRSPAGVTWAKPLPTDTHPPKYSSSLLIQRESYPGKIS